MTGSLTQNPSVRLFFLNIQFLLVYLLLVYLIGFLFPHFSPFWPPAGVTAYGILRYGFRVVPGLFLGAWIGNFWILDWSVKEALFIALGNVSGPLIAATWLRRGEDPWKGFETVRDVKSFFLFMGVLGSALTALVGATVLISSPKTHGAVSLGEAWISWWTSDSSSILMLAPAIFSWLASGREPRTDLSSQNRFSRIALIFLLTLIGFLIYLLPGREDLARLGLTGIFLPFLVWEAMVGSQREVFTLLGGVLLFQFVGTAMGYGPFSHLAKTPQDAMVGMQLLGLSMSGATLLVSALTLERLGARDLLETMNTDLEQRVSDRTKDLESQHEMMKGELLFRQFLLDSLPIPLVMTDELGDLLVTNQAFSRMTGLASDQMAGHPINHFLGDDFFERYPGKIESDSPHSGQEMGHRSTEGILLTGKGEIPAIINTVGMEHPVAGLIITIQDLSQRVFLENRLREREKLFRLIVETLPLPIIITRMNDASLLYANQSVGDLFGTHIHEWIGKSVLSFWRDPADRAYFLSEMKTHGVIFDREFELNHPPEGNGLDEPVRRACPVVR